MIEKFSKEWHERVKDKNSPEWKEYCEGLESFDEAAESSVYVVPDDDNIELDFDGVIAYAKEHYNGIIEKMTDKEKEKFYHKKDSSQRKTA